MQQVESEDDDEDEQEEVPQMKPQNDDDIESESEDSEAIHEQMVSELFLSLKFYHRINFFLGNSCT